MQGGDAAKLLQHLEIERAKNPDWYVQPLIDMKRIGCKAYFI